jgi:site-specific recombinase XerD
MEHLDLTAKSAQVRGKLGKIRLVLLTERAASALREYLGDRQTGFIFQQDYTPQKGHFSAYNGTWISRWLDYTGLRKKPVQRTHVHGKLSQMNHEEALKKHQELMSSVDLTRPRRDLPLSNMAIQCMVRQLGIRAGIRNVTPHTFRRTFATHLHEGGASLEVIRALLGHVWVQTTMRYARVGPDGLAKVFEKSHPFGKSNEPKSP